MDNARLFNGEWSLEVRIRASKPVTPGGRSHEHESLHSQNLEIRFE